MLNFIKNFFSILFPSHCLSCAKIISKDALFCNDDWQKLKFITNPKCKICSHPFEYNISEQQKLICAMCLKKRPYYDHLITIFIYNDEIKKIIKDLKYYDATHLLKKFAYLLYNKIKSEIDSFDLIIAVPLHKKRLRERKFNQAILLSKAILKYYKTLEFYPDVLIRTRYNKAQVGLSQKEREKNLKDIFVINEKYLSKIKDKKILLIDDVMTTGTTINNCSKVLKKAGAKEIVALTIAKTVLNNY